MLRLKRWNTPTIYNGWEACTKRDRLEGLWNRQETRDFMPSLGTMVGRAVTIRIDPCNPAHPGNKPDAWDQWFAHVASLPGPKIIVMQDIGKPGAQGSFWGEVSANTHRSLGCVGKIVDGSIRDLDEMTNAGFKALARRLSVGHLHAWPVDWGGAVEVFGTRIEEGMLVHADKHGFIAIPPKTKINRPRSTTPTSACWTRSLSSPSAWGGASWRMAARSASPRAARRAGAWCPARPCWPSAGRPAPCRARLTRPRPWRHG